MRFPSSAEATPSEWTVVVLATPPFWLATASTSVTCEVYARPPVRGQILGQKPAMPTTGRASRVPPIEPKKGAEKLKTPPSEAPNR